MGKPSEWKLPADHWRFSARQRSFARIAKQNHTQFDLHLSSAQDDLTPISRGGRCARTADPRRVAKSVAREQCPGDVKRQAALQRHLQRVGEKLDTLSKNRGRDKRSVSFACSDANQEMHRLNGNVFGRKEGKCKTEGTERKPLLGEDSIRRLADEVCPIYAAGVSRGFMLVHLTPAQVTKGDAINGKPAYKCKSCGRIVDVVRDKHDKTRFHYLHEMVDSIPLYTRDAIPFNMAAIDETERKAKVVAAAAAAAPRAPCPTSLPKPEPLGPAPAAGRTPSPVPSGQSPQPESVAITVAPSPAGGPGAQSPAPDSPHPIPSGPSPPGGDASAPPSAPPAPVSGSAPPTTHPPGAPPPPPGPPGPAAPANNPPAPSIVKGRDLMGRAIQAREVDDLVEYLGGVRGTGVLSDWTFCHEDERRPVTWRAVRITEADFHVQQLVYQTVNMFWITTIVLASVAAITLGLGAGFYFGHTDLGFTLGVGAVAGMLGLSSLVHRLTRRRGKAIAGLAYLSLVVLLEFARPFPEWLASLLAMLVVIGAYGYAVRRLGSEWMPRSFEGFSLFVLLAPAASAGIVGALVLSHTILALGLSVCAYHLLAALRSLLFPNSTRTVIWCPHMVTNVLLDYSEGTSAEVVRTNTRMKLSRLATLPVPDYMASQLTSGSEQVIYFLAERETFFEAGAAFALQPR